MSGSSAPRAASHASRVLFIRDGALFHQIYRGESSNEALYQTLLAYVEKKECKNGYVMWPVRTAVSGKQMTPAGATEIMEILGKEESLNRIRKGIEYLENAIS